MYFRVLHLAAGGVLNKWTDIYLPLDNKCGKNINLQDTKPFNLENTLGIFLGLFAVISISALIFVIELLSILGRKCKDQK